MPKTIFGTTEKSNFILNMKTERYWQFNLWILLGFLVLMPVMCIPLEFARVYSLPVIALAVTGVAAIVFTFIGFMKSVTPKKLWVFAGLFIAMVAWGYVSLLHSFYTGDPYNFNVATFGADGRGEGLLSVLFYACFFMLGAQLGTDDNRLKLLHGMFWMGLAECAWGLLQALPIGFPSWYRNLEPLMLFRTFLPSGLTGSPIFLATLLAMLTFPAILACAFAESKNRGTFYLVCAFCFTLTAVRTQTLIGLAGTGLAVLAALVCILCKKQGKRGLLAFTAGLLGMCAGFAWSAAAAGINGTYHITEDEPVSGWTLYDGGIMWEDSSYRLEASGYFSSVEEANPNGELHPESLPDTYSYLWRVTGGIIKDYPLVGTGPDSLVYPQLFHSLILSANPNTFDRAYNFYLQTAATMGIPMLLLVCAVLVLSIYHGGRACVRSGWVRSAVLGTVVLYCIFMVIGSSAVTVAPLFWMLAGVCSNMQEE